MWQIEKEQKQVLVFKSWSNFYQGQYYCQLIRYKIMRRKVIGDLLNFFQQMIQFEKGKHQLKVDMAKMGLKPRQIFNKVSKDQKSIMIADMRKYLDGRMACNDRQLYDIFEHFDHARTGVISFADFRNEVVVELKKKKHQFRVKKQDVSQIQYFFVHLLKAIVKSTRILDTWRKQLEILTPYIIFEELDRDKSGVISRKELFKFFYENGKQLNHVDCQILYRSLLRRFYSEINLEVFCQNLKPLEFGYYKGYQYYFQKGIRDELQFKERIVKESKEVQDNFLRERRNNQIVGLVHHEANLNREKELEKRVQDQLRAYQELKYKTMKKFHPQLNFQEFLIMEKENQEINVLKIKVQEEEALMRQVEYKNKIKNVEALREVQKFEENKNRPFVARSVLVGEEEVRRKIPQEDLEKKIRSHAFSSRNIDDFLMKRKVERDLHPIPRVL